MTSISGPDPSIHLLKAQQAWASRQATRPSAPPANNSEPSTLAPILENARLEQANAADSLSAASVPSRLSRAIPEIQDIARRAGFLGVTEQDIQRAYTRGESLLTDYRV